MAACDMGQWDGMVTTRAPRRGAISPVPRGEPRLPASAVRLLVVLDTPSHTDTVPKSECRAARFACAVSGAFSFGVPPRAVPVSGVRIA